MFPIFDVRGDAVGFGARLLGGEGPKYLNSPDSAIYQKSHLLYGLNWAKSAIVREGLAVVVEGYTDVIALAEAGRPLAVATCGTALGESHLDLLRRFTERVVLMFDADEAGVEASLRAASSAACPATSTCGWPCCPTGRDPADLASAGRDGGHRGGHPGLGAASSSSASTRSWSATTWARPRPGGGRCGRSRPGGPPPRRRHPPRVRRRGGPAHRRGPRGGDRGGGAGRPPGAGRRAAAPPRLPTVSPARRRRSRSCCA